MTRGRGVSVHRANCPNVRDLMNHPERMISVEWDTSGATEFRVEIVVEATDRMGLLKDITIAIGDAGGNILSAATQTGKQGIARLRFIVAISDASLLDALLASVSRVPSATTRRIMPGEGANQMKQRGVAMKNYFRDAGSFAASDGGDVVHVFVVGPIQTNCYAYVSAGEALVVDPGAVGARIATALAGEKVVCVAATHGHGDHVGGVAALVSATGAPFAISAATPRWPSMLLTGVFWTPALPTTTMRPSLLACLPRETSLRWERRASRDGDARPHAGRHLPGGEGTAEGLPLWVIRSLPGVVRSH